jgi:hypothetical protein
LYGSQRQPKRARGVFLSETSKEAALDHICQSRHLGGQPAERIVEHYETFVCINAQRFGGRKWEMRLSTSALVGKSGRGVIDQGVMHGKGCGPEEVCLIRITTRLSQAQVSLVNQCGGL